MTHKDPTVRTFNIIPDVVAEDGSLNEVEALDFDFTKISRYSCEKRRKTLWLVFNTNPYLGFDEVKIIHKNEDESFSYSQGFPEGERTVLAELSKGFEREQTRLRNLVNRTLVREREIKASLGRLKKALGKTQNELEDKLTEKSALEHTIRELRKEIDRLDRERKIFLQIKPQKKGVAIVRVSPQNVHSLLALGLIQGLEKKEVESIT